MHAAKYVPIGYRTPSSEEIIARRIAQDLKIPTAAAIQIAAPLMAALIDGPCWLVPVPASNGSPKVNRPTPPVNVAGLLGNGRTLIISGLLFNLRGTF